VKTFYSLHTPCKL